ncbi:MAG: ASKHA domain-containing protein, partial [Peptococcaceae bacterium]|nr:ASKHA domain-containing protein [Peptococcaceae bacterium]
VLFDLPAGAALATAHEMSRQRSYGADVLSRIAYANQNGHLAVGAPLVGQLGDMLRQTLTQAAQKAESVQRLVITGNTTMLHFLTGLDPRGIGAAPFTPQSLFGDSRPAQALFPFLPPEAELYLPPCVSAYIGADITCGILSTDLCRRQETGLLVDVGTNGEMALYADGLLLCCAAAAGPAFEGAEIRMGMSAAAGAIDKLWATEKGAIEWRVIGGGPPAGLCGTGLISAAALLLRQGIMDGGGRLQTAGHPYTEYLSRRDGQIVFQLGDSGVLLTQRDIRNLQLAKAAIRAGLETLLPDAGKTAADIRRLYLAGGFGSFLDPGEAAQIGLIPTALGSKTTAVGNAALTGAARLLFSQSARDEAGRLAAQAREISLTTSQVFMSRYIEQMSFRDE